MPSPKKVSGILNNCSLNPALPPILKVINMLAELETKNELSLLLEEPLYANYLRLRNIFIKEYNLPETLTWNEWHTLLSKYEDNFFLLQLIFAETLRTFLDYFLPHKSKLQNDGRFPNLRIDEASHLYNKLGIYVTEKSARPGIPDDVFAPDRVFPQIPKVEVQYRNHHFDYCLSPSEAEAALDQDKFEREDSLKKLVPALDCSELGATPKGTMRQLEILKKKINASYNEAVLSPIDLEKLNRLNGGSEYKQHIAGLVVRYKLGLFKPSAQAQPQETDEDMAKRLQTEEIEAYLNCIRN